MTPGETLPRGTLALALVLVASACGAESLASDDAGQPRDAGPVVDASTNDDAGGPDDDAGTGLDAGEPEDGGGFDAGAEDAGVAPDATVPPDAGMSSWSAPVSLVENYGRLAIGNRVHIVGHVGSQLIHRSSTDRGLTWSAPDVIAPASGNVPGMYGGLFAEGDNVYLITARDDMASSADVGGRQLDFRRSLDNGATWSTPIRMTTPGQGVFRVRIAASGSYVHVMGAGAPTVDGSLVYIRSTTGGATWEVPRVLASGLGAYGGGQTVAVDGMTVHTAYTTAMMGVGAGPTSYIRSLDGGTTWSTPVIIGEASAEISRQARVQIAAAGGRVFACWQREGSFTGAPLPPDRIGYNASSDSGATWGTARILPADVGVDRNHQHVWMAPGGRVHLLWRIGNTAADPAGTMDSPDLGDTWGPSLVAVDTDELNHPWNIVADDVSVHVLTGPDGAMRYARRDVP